MEQSGGMEQHENSEEQEVTEEAVENVGTEVTDVTDVTEVTEGAVENVRTGTKKMEENVGIPENAEADSEMQPEKPEMVMEPTEQE